MVFCSIYKRNRLDFFCCCFHEKKIDNKIKANAPSYGVWTNSVVEIHTWDVSSYYLSRDHEIPNQAIVKTNYEKKKKTTTKNDKECIQFPFFFFLVFPCCHLCRTPALTSTKLASGMVLLYDVISTSSQVFPSSAAPHSFLFSHRSFRALHQADVKHLSKFRPVLAWLIPGPPASFIMTNCQLFYCLHRLSLPSSTGAASTGQITQLRPTVHYHACLGIRFM